MLNEKDILDFLGGTLDTKGEQRIENETQSNQALADDLKAMSLLWTEAEKLKNFEIFDTETAWDKFGEAISDDDASKVIPLVPAEKEGGIERPLSSKIWSYVAVAATVTLLAIAGYNLFLPEYITVGGDYKWAEVTTLEDGTVVTLDDQESSFTYPRSFKYRDERRVIVNGNATLDVAEDKTKPFLVDNYKAGIRVLGTEFIIESDTSASSLENISGAMRFFDITDTSKFVDLTVPGQKFSFDGTEFIDANPPEASPVAQAPTRIPGDDLGVEFVFDELTSLFPRRIITMPYTVIDTRGIVRIDMNQSLDGIIQQLDSTATINYRRMDGAYYLFSLSK